MPREWEQHMRDAEAAHMGGELELDANHKWSLWSEDESTWEEYAPEALKAMRAMNDSKLTLNLASRKEIRYGRITITGSAEIEGEPGDLTASGIMASLWDDYHDLVDTLDLPNETDDEHDQSVDILREVLPYACGYDSPGITHEFTVHASSVAELLRFVDAEELKLIEESARQWRETEAWAEYMGQDMGAEE